LPCRCAASAARAAVTDRRAQDREFLVGDAQLTISSEQFLQLRLHLLAVGAAVVEKFDECYVAFRVAADRCLRIVENLLASRGEGLLGLLAGLALELFFGRSQSLDQHVGVLQQIIVDDAFDGPTLFGRDVRGAHRAQRRRREEGTTEHEQSDRRPDQHGKEHSTQEGHR
jgi:hypothetical protein